MSVFEMGGVLGGVLGGVFTSISKWIHNSIMPKKIVKNAHFLGFAWGYSAEPLPHQSYNLLSCRILRHAALNPVQKKVCDMRFLAIQSTFENTFLLIFGQGSEPQDSGFRRPIHIAKASASGDSANSPPLQFLYHYSPTTYGFATGLFHDSVPLLYRPAY